MAQKQSSAIDLNQSELLNPRAQNLAAAPGNAVPGQWWFNTVTGRIEYRGNAAVIDPTDRANHTGTQLSATISDLAITVKAYRLDEFAAPTANLNLNGIKLTNGAAGTVGTDFVTKSQLDGVQSSIDQAISGLDIKESVRAAATANIMLTGITAIDGYTLAGTNQRVLLPAQSDPVENGIYLWNAGNLTRAPDADTGELSAGAIVMVEANGTTNKNTSWRLESTDPITVGTTPQSWIQFARPFTPIQGPGIKVSGSEISADVVSVFGRVGAIVATAGDYSASKITNDSSISGATVKDALDSLTSQVGSGIKKFTALVGDGVQNQIVINHTLGTDAIAQVREVATKAVVGCDIVFTSATSITLAFTTPPAANSLYLVMQG